MSNRLTASRGELLAALEAAGIAHSTTGKFAAPCVLVEPGDPWAAVDLSLGARRVGRWRLTLVAGRADSAGSLERLADLVDATDAALLTVPGVQLPTWARPFDTTLDGAAYAATAATVQLQTKTPQEVTP
jgi:hypothetical protein